MKRKPSTAFAIHAYRKLIEMDNIQLVRDLLGHSSVVVTEIYTQMPLEYLKQIYEKKESGYAVKGST